MKKSLFVIILAALICTAGLVLNFFCTVVMGHYEKWVPYVPQGEHVELCYWEKDGLSYVNVSIMFSSSGFAVSDWGTPTYEGNSISVDSRIWMWTGVSLTVITFKNYTYNLGVLHPGEYNFTFRSWGLKVKTVTFNVSRKMWLTTDKSIYKLRENVTVILINVGYETVHIGGYPAWQIFTYPEGKPVYPKAFAFLAWNLDPGENDTFTWNQFNDFNKTFCEPGTYVLKDTQGWGAVAYFQIISDDIQVPEFPPTAALLSTLLLTLLAAFLAKKTKAICNLGNACKNLEKQIE